MESCRLDSVKESKLGDAKSRNIKQHLIENFFLSDSLRVLRNGFHSASSISSAMLKDGIVLPIYYKITVNSTTIAAAIPILLMMNSDDVATTIKIILQLELKGEAAFLAIFVVNFTTPFGS